MRKTIRKKMLLLPIILLLTISALNVSMPSVSAIVSPYVAVVPTSIVDETKIPYTTFTVDIYTDYAGSDIWAYQFTLAYNPFVIQGIGVINGDLITNDGFPPFPPPPARFKPGDFDNTVGVLSLTLAYFHPDYSTPIPTTTGPGILATVTFEVIDYGTSDIILGPETQLKGASGDIVNGIVNPDQIGHGWFDNTGGTGELNPPVASFTWSPATPYPGETVDFNAEGSYDLDGVIVSYAWDFNDTNTGIGLEPMHAYATAGSYIVTLTVTDDSALTDTATATIEVAPPLQMDLIKWKAKPEHKHFDISKDEDAYCDLTALVRNAYEVDKEVTVEFIIINKETTEIETVTVTDTVYAGTDMPLTSSDWIPSPGTYSISVTGTFDEGTTSTKITRVGVVP